MLRFLAIASLLVGCGSSSSTTPDAHTGSGSGSGSGSGTALTVINYDVWCSVAVNGGTASTAAQQVVDVSPGTITLVASPASSTFEIGGDMWHHTNGDTGSGETGTVAGSGTTATSTAMVTVGSAAKCVWVCCPFANGTGCTGLADQCP
jgi:hypothetical protein